MTRFHNYCHAVGFVVLLVVLGVQSLVSNSNSGTNNNNNNNKVQQQQQQSTLNNNYNNNNNADATTTTILSSRRSWMMTNAAAMAAGAAATTMAMSPALPAHAAADCFKDCMKNCKLIAPKDPDYCTANCKDYCEQEGREDGLSGSVSAANGEVGILGGTFGQGTVPKGEDKPPSISLPGLDFSSDKGKKLIGY